jgi:signal recognition particle subunit SRP54
MFEGLTKSLSNALKRLTGGRLTEANIREGLEVIRRALLDADVNYNVVNTFISRVTEKAVGQDIIKSVAPGQQIVKVVYDELVALMGPVDHTIHFAKDRPTVLMLCGLQGHGKTTTAGKLALTLQQKGRKPMLVAADLQRPAAIDQLIILGQQIGVPVYSETGTTPLTVCNNALKEARKQGLDTVILDTAGRLHIAEMPMEELRAIDKSVKPDEIFLVCDAMTGQDAVNSAKAFHEALDLNGVIMTKLDGDTRGGAALSIKEVAKVPIKFIGVGEKLDRLENFQPEGMAQRILGQGDLMGLVQKITEIQTQQDQEKLLAQQKKIEKGNFTLADFRSQFEMMKKMGMKNVMGMMPGMGEMLAETDEDPEDAFKRMQGMIDSMTAEERKNPDIIDLSRRRRIAKGCGCEPHEIKKFLDQFSMMRGIMKQMMQMSLLDRFKMITGLGKMGAFLPGGPMMKKPKGDTGHRKTAKERAEERKKKKKKR